MHLFAKFFFDLPNFALPAHKIMLVLGNNNLYTETNKQTVEISIFVLKKEKKSGRQGLLWRGGGYHS
jgi:hypothetical protein